jgi:hypothetical protein
MERTRVSATLRKRPKDPAIHGAAQVQGDFSSAPLPAFESQFARDFFDLRIRSRQQNQTCFEYRRFHGCARFARANFTHSLARRPFRTRHHRANFPSQLAKALGHRPARATRADDRNGSVHRA